MLHAHHARHYAVLLSLAQADGSEGWGQERHACQTGSRQADAGGGHDSATYAAKELPWAARPPACRDRLRECTPLPLEPVGLRCTSRWHCASRESGGLLLRGGLGGGLLRGSGVCNWRGGQLGGICGGERLCSGRPSPLYISPPGYLRLRFFEAGSRSLAS